MKSFLIAFALVALSGCSTFFNLGRQEILILPSDSAAINKKIYITVQETKQEATLPIRYQVDSLNAHINVTFVNECWASSTVRIERSITPSYWANILTGFGFIWDGVFGTLWKYPSTIVIPTERLPHCVETGPTS